MGSSLKKMDIFFQKKPMQKRKIKCSVKRFRFSQKYIFPPNAIPLFNMILSTKRIFAFRPEKNKKAFLFIKQKNHLFRRTARERFIKNQIQPGGITFPVSINFKSIKYTPFSWQFKKKKSIFYRTAARSYFFETL